LSGYHVISLVDFESPVVSSDEPSRKQRRAEFTSVDMFMCELLKPVLIMLLIQLMLNINGFMPRTMSEWAGTCRASWMTS